MMNDPIPFDLSLQDFPLNCLYIVATPIGNLADLTLRARYVLSLVDGIACEDTRHTSHLLNSLGIQKPLFSLHQHNENEAAEKLISMVKSGSRWAYVSDAGTPGVSDPGARLTSKFIRAGMRVIPIPGVSAITTLLSVAGEALEKSHGLFQFYGFLPTKKNERLQILNQLNFCSLATLFYEAPQRIEKMLTEVWESTINKNRSVIIGRELTKKFETLSHLTVAELPQWLKLQETFKGEFSILIQGEPSTNMPIVDGASEVNVNINLLAANLAGYLGSKQIAEIFSTVGIMSKNDAYQLALANKNPST
ncbi:MAG: 16S rRNA (cytidine(1402)-2'-O)-methyltransferase [Betaproteobacteria bacterium]